MPKMKAIYASLLVLSATLTAYAAEPAAPPDVLRNAVDPYNPSPERDKFRRAAGVDSVLEQAEYEADAATGKGYVRVFDKWATMKAFDGNRDGKIDWTEAEAYRSALRKAVVAQYDKNASRKLDEEERSAANRDLAAGKVPKVDPTSAATTLAAAPAPTPAAPAAPQNTRAQRRADAAKRFDTDGDGQLSPEERVAQDLEAGREFRQGLIAQHDKDGDGQLNEAEKLAMRPDQQWGLRLQDLAMKHFDENADGEIDKQEGQAMAAFGQKLEQVGQEWRLAIVDLNKDGAVTPDEEQQIQQRFQAVAINMLPKAQAWADSNGDGSASPEEWQGLAQRVSKTAEQQVATWTQRFDSDSDGRLGATERDALVQGIREDAAQRYKRHDADGDGQLDVQEWATFADELATEWGAKPQ